MNFQNNLDHKGLVSKMLIDISQYMHLHGAYNAESKTILTGHCIYIHSQTSNMSRTSVGNKIVDHSDVVGASLVAVAPTTSSFST